MKIFQNILFLESLFFEKTSENGGNVNYNSHYEEQYGDSFKN